MDDETVRDFVDRLWRRGTGSLFVAPHPPSETISADGQWLERVEPGARPEEGVTWTRDRLA